MTQRRGRLRAAVASAPLRTRVMVAAGILVALSSLATGILGATLLRGYLLDRADVQLQDFAVVASRVLARPHSPAPPGSQQGLPTQFLVELVSPDGSVHVAGGPVSRAPVLRLSAAQLAEKKVPFTVQAGNPAHSWRG
jgi:hypothetical protein